MSNNVTPLLAALREQKAMRLKGGIYHKTQIDLTYNSNHIEGSRLTHDQTRYIFETNTIGVTSDESINVNDIVETVNHFRCIELIIDRAEEPLSEELVKTLHGILKTGTSNSRKDWFVVGDYKQLPNEVGGEQTCEPELVHDSMQRSLMVMRLRVNIHWRTYSTFMSVSRRFIRSKTATVVWDDS